MTAAREREVVCRHPVGDVHVLHSVDYVEKWCSACGALYYSGGWQGERGRWRKPRRGPVTLRLRVAT